MKIYFGYVPCVAILDSILAADLKEVGIEKVMDNFVEANINREKVYWTINPLLINYLEDNIASEILYYISDGKIIKFGDDPVLMEKLQFMGPGEALVDSEHVLGV